MAAAPAVSGGRPTVTETVANVQTLSRSFTDLDGHDQRQRDCFRVAIVEDKQQFGGLHAQIPICWHLLLPSFIGLSPDATPALLQATPVALQATGASTERRPRLA